MDYTWAQFNAFTTAVAARRQAQRRDLLALVLVASRGSPESVTAMSKTLES